MHTDEWTSYGFLNEISVIFVYIFINLLLYIEKIFIAIFFTFIVSFLLRSF